MVKAKRDERLDLPPLELECMKALWRSGRATVHQIRAELLPERPLAYTTVMTMMSRLAHKGAVVRSRHGRAHVYEAAVSATEVRDHALTRLLENFFQASRDELRRHLDGEGLVSPPDTRGKPVASIPGADAGGHPRGASEESIDPALL